MAKNYKNGLIDQGTGADLDRVDGVPKPCQRFQNYQISGFETYKLAN